MATKTPAQQIGLAVQRHGLLAVFPNSQCTIHKSCLQWTGTLQPSPLSACYMVQLSYVLKFAPKVRVLDPPLQQREGRSAPHRYSNGNLCLYLPEANEWAPHMRLVDVIVPWASEWLLHYEYWLVTGEWQGGGTHSVRYGQKSSGSSRERGLPRP